MAFAKKNTDSSAVKAQASNYINGSGIYPVNILAAFLDTNEHDSHTINLFVDHQGQEQVIYGQMRITNNGGEENKIGAKVFNHLLVVADIDEVSFPEDMDLPIGKEGKDKTVAVLTDIKDVDVLIRVQMEYSKYKGNIMEKKVIRDFYRSTDGATAEEVVNDENFGEGLEKDRKFENNVTYKDNLTPEDIEKWIASGRKSGGSTAGGSSSPAASPTFGGNKKRFGKKSS